MTLRAKKQQITKKNPTVTIFTPTYNRGYIIHKLFESLKNQTCHDFEWIIIDDGSSDLTEQIVNKWISSEENLFSITYLKKENGGKHRAINQGADLAKGILFFIVDSDDVISPDAVEKIIKWEADLPSHIQFAGVAGNRSFSNKAIIGKTFEGHFVDASSLEREKYNIMGDKAEVFYTHILRKYKFPEFEGENFITESVVWFKIASDGYKIRWFNDIIYTTEYLSDGLTLSGDNSFIKNPLGALYSCKKELKYKELSFKWKLSRLVRFLRISRDNGKSLIMIGKDLEISFLFVFIAFLALRIKGDK